MVTAVAELSGQAFRWNLSADVGSRQPNRLDDVELVRFGYYCMSQDTRFPPDPKLRPVLQAMRSLGPFDQDLANVIVTHQRNRRPTQDGKVSVAKVSFTSTNRERYDGAHSWIIISLNNNMIDIAGDVYPRIDKHPASGPEVSKAVKKIFGVS